MKFRPFVKELRKWSRRDAKVYASFHATNNPEEDITVN